MLLSSNALDIGYVTYVWCSMRDIVAYKCKQCGTMEIEETGVDGSGYSSTPRGVRMRI